MSEMADRSSAELQSLIDRMMAGDPAGPGLLLDRAYVRLERVVAGTFRKAYSRLKNHHDTGSIVSETYLRLRAALQGVQASADERQGPMSVGDFFRLAASKTHQVCIDLVRKVQVRQAAVAPTGSAGDDASLAAAPLPEQVADGEPTDPAVLELWTELHRRVEALPSEEREVFQMSFYLDMKRVEVARVLGLHPKEASRRWVAATEKLKGVLNELSSD